MKRTKLIIQDEINCKFENLDVVARRKLVQSVEFFIPQARHTPSYRLGRWNGTTSYADLSGRSYLNLLDILIPVVTNAGYEIEIEDKRQNYDFQFTEVHKDSYQHVKWPKGHPLEGQSVEFREHQLEVINNCLNNIQSVSVCPTSGGKTIITAALSHKVEPYGRSIVIVPTKDLVVQTEEDYINFGLDVGVYFGDRKDQNKTHTICTWQSLERMSELKDGTLDKFLEGVICVIVDECHKAKSTALKKLLSGPFKDVPLRWGLTGTLPDQDHEKMCVLAMLGPVSGVIRARDLQDMGYMANLHIHIHQLKDIGDMFGSYQDELKWLTTNKSRLDYIASFATEVSQSGNTLILVDRIEAGKSLQKRLEGSVFISGAIKSATRKEEYKSVQTEDNKIIIATYAVASTGINMPRLFNLILFEPGKSFVRVIQSIGRSLRMAQDKDFANVYDIASTCKYSKSHLAKRKKYYDDQQYPYTLKKVDY